MGQINKIMQIIILDDKQAWQSAIIFMIWPILEAKAEIEKYFRSVFGSNENFKVCFRN